MRLPPAYNQTSRNGHSGHCRALYARLTFVPGSRARHSLPLASPKVAEHYRFTIGPREGTDRLHVAVDWPAAAPREGAGTNAAFYWLILPGRRCRWHSANTVPPPPTQAPLGGDPRAPSARADVGQATALSTRPACGTSTPGGSRRGPSGGDADGRSAWSAGSPPKSDDPPARASAATAPPRATPRRPGGTRLSRWATLLPPCPPPPPSFPPRQRHTPPHSWVGDPQGRATRGSWGGRTGRAAAVAGCVGPGGALGQAHPHRPPQRGVGGLY